MDILLNRLMICALAAMLQGCAHWAPMPAREISSEVIYRQYDSVTIQYRTQQERTALLAFLNVKEGETNEN